jgi:hypothetical protein
MLIALVIAVSVVGAAVLVVLLVRLIRHLRLVAISIQQLQRELLPTLERIQADAEEARRRLDRLGGGAGPSPG